jgi:phosphate transport system substrate-binding protein
VTETGSTLLYPLFNLWVGGYNTTYPSVTVQTAGTGSGTGISDAENGTIDIGASDAYLAPSVTAASPDLKNIPLAISSQIVAYNVPGVLSHLKLTGKVLSAIYQGTITKWNASQIASLNPGVTLPSIPIVTLHRSTAAVTRSSSRSSCPRPTRRAGAPRSPTTRRCHGRLRPAPSVRPATRAW